MSDQDGDLPEMNDGPPADGEPLSVCPIDPEERLDTERVLGLFAPRTPRLKRERLMELVANVRREAEFGSSTKVRFRTPWYWPAATAALTATSLSLAVLLAVRVNAEPPVRVEFKERIVYKAVSLPSAAPTLSPQAEVAMQTVNPPTQVLEPAPTDDYLRSRSIALSQGVDGLDYRQRAIVGGTPNSPATREELLRQLGPKSPPPVMSRSMQTGATSKGWIWPSW